MTAIHGENTRTLRLCAPAAYVQNAYPSLMPYR